MFFIKGMLFCFSKFSFQFHSEKIISLNSSHFDVWSKFVYTVAYILLFIV